MTEITFMVPNWFYWVFAGYMVVSAITAIFQVRLKYRIYKAHESRQRVERMSGSGRGWQ